MTLILIGLLFIALGYFVGLSIDREREIEQLRYEIYRFNQRLLDQGKIEANLRIHLQERHEHIHYCRKTMYNQMWKIHELNHLLEVAKGNINPQLYIRGPYDFPIQPIDI